MKHGPIALADERLFTIALMPQTVLYEKTKSNVEELAARDAYIIELDRADLDSEIVSWCSRTGENPLEFALLGGEDYALVAVVDKQAVVRLGDELGLQGRVIGTVCKKAGIFLQGVPLTCQGFDHFSYQ